MGAQENEESTQKRKAQLGSWQRGQITLGLGTVRGEAGRGEPGCGGRGEQRAAAVDSVLARANDSFSVCCR